MPALALAGAAARGRRAGRRPVRCCPSLTLSRRPGLERRRRRRSDPGADADPGRRRERRARRSGRTRAARRRVPRAPGRRQAAGTVRGPDQAGPGRGPLRRARTWGADSLTARLAGALPGRAADGGDPRRHVRCRWSTWSGSGSATTRRTWSWTRRRRPAADPGPGPGGAGRRPGPARGTLAATARLDVRLRAPGSEQTLPGRRPGTAAAGRRAWHAEAGPSPCHRLRRSRTELASPGSQALHRPVADQRLAIRRDPRPSAVASWSRNPLAPALSAS